MEKHHLKNILDLNFGSKLSLHHRLSEMLKASCDLAFGAAEFWVKLHLGGPWSHHLLWFADLPWSAHTPFQYLPISSNIYFPIIYIYIFQYLPKSSHHHQRSNLYFRSCGWYNGCREAAQFSDKSPIARSQKNLSSPVSERDWKSGLTMFNPPSMAALIEKPGKMMTNDDVLGGSWGGCCKWVKFTV